MASHTPNPPQIFSGAIALTLLTFLVNLLNSTYYTAISFGDWFMFYGGGLSYTVTVICYFYLLCGRADALRAAVSGWGEGIVLYS